MRVSGLAAFGGPGGGVLRASGVKATYGGKMSLEFEWDPAKAKSNLQKHQVSFDSMKKDYDDYELREEYDLSELPIMPKGRYAPERKAGKNLVVLDPDVAQAFPNDEAVNAALRLILQITRIPEKATAS